MINLKINRKRKIKVPTDYADLSFEKLEKLAGLTNNLDIIEVMLELEEEDKNKPFNTVSAAIVARSIKFLEKPLPDKPLAKRKGIPNKNIIILRGYEQPRLTSHSLTPF